jgi:hypothetical protein
MRILAYCIAPAREAVRAATGVAPLTSPPWTADVLRPERLRGYDLLYVRLHGLPNVAYTWFGEGERGTLVPALSKEHLDALEPDGLGGAVVVLANCYGADSPMVKELYQAGASAVIAGHGPNIAAANRLVGTDLLVRWIIIALRAGLSASRSLHAAKARLALSAWRAADRDAMQFVLVNKEALT